MSTHDHGGVRLHIEFDDAPLLAHLERLVQSERGGFKALRREIGAYMLGQVQDNFDRQTLFDGTPMPPSEAAKGGVFYKRIKSGKRKGKLRKVTVHPRKTLMDTRALYRSYTYNLVGAAGLEIGSDMAYARIHHFGGETGRSGARFTLPARPVLGMTPADRRYVGELMLAELRRQA
jgi:phage virion morphogenesis protein